MGVEEVDPVEGGHGAEPFARDRHVEGAQLKPALGSHARAFEGLGLRVWGLGFRRGTDMFKGII